MIILRNLYVLVSTRRSQICDSTPMELETTLRMKENLHVQFIGLVAVVKYLVETHILRSLILCLICMDSNDVIERHGRFSRNQ